MRLIESMTKTTLKKNPDHVLQPCVSATLGLCDFFIFKNFWNFLQSNLIFFKVVLVCDSTSQSRSLKWNCIEKRKILENKKSQSPKVPKTQGWNMIYITLFLGGQFTPIHYLLYLKVYYTSYCVLHTNLIHHHHHNQQAELYFYTCKQCSTLTE